MKKEIEGFLGLKIYKQQFHLRDWLKSGEALIQRTNLLIFPPFGDIFKSPMTAGSQIITDL